MSTQASRDMTDLAVETARPPALVLQDLHLDSVWCVFAAPGFSTQ